MRPLALGRDPFEAALQHWHVRLSPAAPEAITPFEGKAQLGPVEDGEWVVRSMPVKMVMLRPSFLKSQVNCERHFDTL